MAQQVNVLAHKPGDLGLIPGTLFFFFFLMSDVVRCWSTSLTAKREVGTAESRGDY